MCEMWRHCKRNNIVIIIIFNKLDRMTWSMAIKNKKALLAIHVCDTVGNARCETIIVKDKDWCSNHKWRLEREKGRMRFNSNPQLHFWSSADNFLRVRLVLHVVPSLDERQLYKRLLTRIELSRYYVHESTHFLSFHLSEVSSWSGETCSQPGIASFCPWTTRLSGSRVELPAFWASECYWKFRHVQNRMMIP